jgi:hypothetical protein
MGQKKGNQIPTYQDAAYIVKYPNTNARENRDMGTKPVMIDDETTLNEVVDITFETDAVAAMVSASLNTTIYAVSQSIETTLATKTTIGSNALFNNVAATSNGLGQNFKVGDDVWLGDRNVSNTMVISGIQEPTSAIIQLGSGSQPSIAHLVEGASFPAIGSALAITGSLLIGHTGHLYFFNGGAANGGWAQII